MSTNKSSTKSNSIITNDDIQEMKNLANGFANTLHHDYQRDAFNNFSNCVIKNMKKISKHVEKMNRGWNGN